MDDAPFREQATFDRSPRRAEGPAPPRPGP
ncbi:MAG: hypothetical protein RLZZ228_412, partial [Actinomycetota bacterium]